MKFNKIVSLFLLILFIFGLSGCTKPLPQHSKGQLKSYAKENYGNIAKVVSFENERDKNILVIEDNLGFTYEVESKSYETFIDQSIARFKEIMGVEKIEQCYCC